MDLTPKAERTRGLLLDTALRLFAEQGYGATTMRDIATAAGTSTGLTYRYFRRKEELARALYAQLADELVARAADLPPGTVAERYAAVLHAKVALIEPHRGALTALFAAALDPDDDVGVLSAGTAPVRQRVQDALLVAVEAASDAPPAPERPGLVRRLYLLHLLVLLGWTQDRSSDRRITRAAVDLVRDALTLLLPLLRSPVAAPLAGRLDALVDVLLPLEVSGPGSAPGA